MKKTIFLKSIFLLCLLLAGKTVTHQVGSTAVVYATGKLGSQSQVLLLLPEHQQAAVRGKAHSIGRSLDHEVFYGGEVKFL
jgi:hypothetical protein